MLFRFFTSKYPKERSSLDQVLSRMAENQKNIYYHGGDSVEALENSPHMKAFKAKDIEVLYLVEPTDESCLQRVVNYEGKKLVNIQKGDLALDKTPEEEKKFKKIKKVFDPLAKWWKGLLLDRVGKVDVSENIIDDPVAISASQYGYSSYMEKIMKAQVRVLTACNHTVL